MPKHEIARGDRASQLITQRIRDLGDWRGEVLAKMRAIDIHEGDRVNGRAFQELVRAAVALNRSKPKKRK